MSLTLEQIFDQKIPERLQTRADKIANLKAIYQFDVIGEGGGSWLIDLSQTSPKISAGTSSAAQCTVTIQMSDFVDMIEGKLNPQMAFMSGKLKVRGDMSLALKLGAIL